ncbi:MAG: substrate-binding domain-containing protein [Ruthenibacterium sp.]
MPGQRRNQLARYTGFQRALAEYGLHEQEDVSVNLPEVSIENARAAIAQLLARKVPFDGIMCTTDTIAAGAIIALREHNLHVPKDVLLTGFDDSQLAAACGPGITSVHQDVSKMAELATTLLLEISKKARQKTLSAARLLVKRPTQRCFCP